MKRKGLIIATSVVFAVVLCALCARRPILRYRFYKTALWQFNADYKACAEDFNTVKDYFSDNYQGGPDKLFSVSMGHNSIRVFDLDAKEYVELPDNIVSSLDNISKNGFTYKDSVFDTISVKGRRISFGIENNHYCLVFSPDERPKWIHSPDDGEKIAVKRIGGGWYHVTIKG